MIARVIHANLNALGGSERLAVATIRALCRAGFRLTLETSEQPSAELLNKAYGIDLSQLVAGFRTLRFATDNPAFEKIDLYFNTHGDIVPYFRRGMSKANSITYCHFPLAGHLLSSRDKEYESFYTTNMMVGYPPTVKSKFFDKFLRRYSEMLESTTVITNSEFSRNAIMMTYGIESRVIPPPVDVELFQKAVQFPSTREDLVLVVSRYHPSKRIENAVRIASKLKERRLARGMIIVGNLSPAGLVYRDYLISLVKKYKLDDFVNFVYNASFSRLFHYMHKCSVYLHPLPGEPFGISTVEAMSAGMIPVVHNIGGHSEFVPAAYQFRTFGSALDAISRAMHATHSERLSLSKFANRFSAKHYISEINDLVEEMQCAKIDIPAGTANSKEILPLSKFNKAAAA